MKSKTKETSPAKVKYFSRISAENTLINEATLCSLHFRKEFYAKVNSYYDGTHWVENKSETNCLVCEGEEL